MLIVPLPKGGHDGFGRSSGWLEATVRSVVTSNVNIALAQYKPLTVYSCFSRASLDVYLSMYTNQSWPICRKFSDYLLLLYVVTYSVPWEIPSSLAAIIPIHGLNFFWLKAS